MWDKPPSQLIKAGAERGDSVILGPLGAGQAAHRDWGLSLYIGGFTPIFPLALRLQGTGRTWKADTAFSKPYYVPGWARGWGESHKHGILPQLRDLDAAALL